MYLYVYEWGDGRARASRCGVGNLPAGSKHRNYPLALEINQSQGNLHSKMRQRIDVCVSYCVCAHVIIFWRISVDFFTYVFVRAPLTDSHKGRTLDFSKSLDLLSTT